MIASRTMTSSRRRSWRYNRRAETATTAPGGGSGSLKQRRSRARGTARGQLQFAPDVGRLASALTAVRQSKRRLVVHARAEAHAPPRGSTSPRGSAAPRGREWASAQMPTSRRRTSPPPSPIFARSATTAVKGARVGGGGRS